MSMAFLPSSMVRFAHLLGALVLLLVAPPPTASSLAMSPARAQLAKDRRHLFLRTPRPLRRNWLVLLRGGDQEVGDASGEGISEEGSVGTGTFADSAGSSGFPSQRSAAVPPALFAALGSLGRSYTAQLGRRPILTKSATAGLIFGLSDYLAQKIESSRGDDKVSSGESGNAMDSGRLLASVLIGLLYFGPAAHYWYEWIFRLLPGTGLASTMYKAGLGQILFG